MERTVKKGDKVRVHYTGTFNDGTVFDSSVLNNRPPLEFVVGSGMMIKGFDAGVVGMAVGETKTLHLSPAEAYGEREPENVFEFPANRLPPDYTPKAGDRLLMGNLPITVTEVKPDGSVVIDANHELAGKELNFVVGLIEIL